MNYSCWYCRWITSFESLYFFILVNICTEKNTLTQRKLLITQSWIVCCHVCIPQNTCVRKVSFCSLIMNPKPFANSHLLHLCVAFTACSHLCCVLTDLFHSFPHPCAIALSTWSGFPPYWKVMNIEIGFFFSWLSEVWN